MIIHTLSIKRGVHQAKASASNWTAINIKIFWWRNVNLCEWIVNLRILVRKADGVGEQQLSARDSNYHKNILVEEREFMRMER